MKNVEKELLQGHNTTWVNIFDSTCAYYYAVTGQTERIPALFGAHMLSTVNFLAPGRPMMEMIENQVYLAQGEYSEGDRKKRIHSCHVSGSSLRSGGASCADPASCGQLEAGEKQNRRLNF